MSNFVFGMHVHWGIFVSIKFENYNEHIDKGNNNADNSSVIGNGRGFNNRAFINIKNYKTNRNRIN